MPAAACAVPQLWQAVSQKVWANLMDDRLADTQQRCRASEGTLDSLTLTGYTWGLFLWYFTSSYTSLDLTPEKEAQHTCILPLHTHTPLQGILETFLLTCSSAWQCCMRFYELFHNKFSKALFRLWQAQHVAACVGGRRWHRHLQASDGRQQLRPGNNKI